MIEVNVVFKVVLKCIINFKVYEKKKNIIRFKNMIVDRNIFLIIIYWHNEAMLFEECSMILGKFIIVSITNLY